MQRCDWVVTPESLIARAVDWGYLTDEEAESQEVKNAALEEAQDLMDWPEGHGFGSSDMTGAVKSFLRYAGIKTDFVNGILQRVEN